MRQTTFQSRQALITLVSGSVLAVVLTGCVTKATADARARDAYLAGQRDGMAKMQQQQAPTVSLMGAVRHSSMPWAPDLTLAKAIVEADYSGEGDPKEILLVRNFRAIQIDLKRLLAGEEIPLQPGDIVQIK
jgi:hypothetical protein